MKNIFLIALSGMLLISSVSCDDFLTETPTVSIQEDQAFVTSQGYNNALTGLYQTLGRYTFLGRERYLPLLPWPFYSIEFLYLSFFLLYFLL